MGTFFKIKNALTGRFESPRDYEKPIEFLPWAIQQVSEGRGTIRTVRHFFYPEELDLAVWTGEGRKVSSIKDIVKARMKGAVKFFIIAGWLTAEDLAELGLERIQRTVGVLGSFPIRPGQFSQIRLERNRRSPSLRPYRLAQVMLEGNRRSSSL